MRFALGNTSPLTPTTSRFWDRLEASLGRGRIRLSKSTCKQLASYFFCGHYRLPQNGLGRKPAAVPLGGAARWHASSGMREDERPSSTPPSPRAATPRASPCPLISWSSLKTITASHLHSLCTPQLSERTHLAAPSVSPACSTSPQPSMALIAHLLLRVRADI